MNLFVEMKTTNRYSFIKATTWVKFLHNKFT